MTEDHWTYVCDIEELAQGEYRVVDVDDVDIAVYNVEGEYFAIEDVCTHDGAPLSGGGMDDHQLICPRHGARFCLKTGSALTPPAYEAAAVFPVRLHDGSIFIRDDRWD